MSKRKEPNPDPDPADPVIRGPGGTSLDTLMAQAEALAKELGVEVGAPKQPADPPAGSSDGAEEPPPDPVVQVEKVAQAVAETAEQVGADPPRAGSSAEDPPAIRSEAPVIAGLDPSEWETEDKDIPTIEEGAESRPATVAERPRVGSQGLPSEEEVHPPGAPVEGKLRELPQRQGLLGLLTGRGLPVVRGVRPELDRIRERLLSTVRAVFARLDKPFRWVPLEFRPLIGYVAALTLAMAVVTLVLGWRR